MGEAQEGDINDIFQILDRFGGVQNIPDDELASAGYKRLTPDRVAPIGFEPPQLIEDAESKYDARPFDTVDVQTHTLDMKYKRIHEDQMRVLKKKLEVFEEVPSRDDIKIMEYLFPNQSPIFQLYDKLKQYLKDTQSPDHVDDILREVFYYFSYYHTAAIPITNHALFPELITDSYKVIDGELVILPEKTEKIARTLERHTSKMTDVEELEKKFKDRLTDPLSLINEDTEEIYEHLMPLYNDYDLSTPLQVISHLFEKLLYEYGLEKQVLGLSDTDSLESLRSKIISLTNDNEITKALSDQEKELKAKLRAASDEERIILSGKIKSVKQDKKIVKQILAGMQQFLDQPSQVAQSIKRIMDDIQNSLTISGDGSDTVVFRLDGRPNDKLDSDPGAISGDCTAGSPLPFSEPSVPVYNIKVYLGDTHIGNMYLLQTTDAQDKNIKVWHLDAIQIPSQRVDWSKGTIQNLLNSLTSEAEKKGVSQITVNANLPQISNYEYISNGIYEYWTAVAGRKATYIDIPDNPNTDKYSDFQCSGYAHILWQQPSSKS